MCIFLLGGGVEVLVRVVEGINGMLKSCYFKCLELRVLKWVINYEC